MSSSKGSYNFKMPHTGIYGNVVFIQISQPPTAKDQAAWASLYGEHMPMSSKLQMHGVWYLHQVPEKLW